MRAMLATLAVHQARAMRTDDKIRTAASQRAVDVDVQLPELRTAAIANPESSLDLERATSECRTLDRLQALPT
jgi:hypothetical protein